MFIHSLLYTYSYVVSLSRFISSRDLTVGPMLLTITSEEVLRFLYDIRYPVIASPPLSTGGLQDTHIESG